MRLPLFYLSLIAAFRMIHTDGVKTKRMYGLCPPDFHSIGSVCYYVSNKRINWLDAHFECRDRNSKLAEPIRLADKQLRKYMLSNDESPDPIWIGGTFVSNNNKWVWGYSGNEIKYQSFSRVDSRRSYDLQYHCALLNPELRYRWSASPCVDMNRYICQHKMPKVSGKNREKIYLRWNQTFPHQMANEVLLEAADNGRPIRNHRKWIFGGQSELVSRNEVKIIFHPNTTEHYVPKKHGKHNEEMQNTVIASARHRTDFDKIAERKRQKELKRRKKTQQRRKQKKMYGSISKIIEPSSIRTQSPLNEEHSFHKMKKKLIPTLLINESNNNVLADSSLKEGTNQITAERYDLNLNEMKIPEDINAKEYQHFTLQFTKQNNISEILLTQNEPTKDDDNNQLDADSHELGIDLQNETKKLPNKQINAQNNANIFTSAIPFDISTIPTTITPLSVTTAYYIKKEARKSEIGVQKSLMKQAARMEALRKYKEKLRKQKEEKEKLHIRTMPKIFGVSSEIEPNITLVTNSDNPQITEDEKKLRLRKLRERIEQLSPEQRRKFHELRMQRKMQKLKKPHISNE